MSERKTSHELSQQNMLPVIFGVILVLVLFAMFSGDRDDDNHADLDISGSMQKGVFVNNDWADIEVSAVNSYAARKYNISPRTKGVVIVERDGNRDVLMKLREGDVITGINNIRIDDLRDFRKASQYVNPIEGMFLEIQRNGLPMFVSISGSNPVSGNYPTAFLRNITGSPIVQQRNQPFAPPITSDAPMTHEYRGPCSNCHPIVDPVTYSDLFRQAGRRRLP